LERSAKMMAEEMIHISTINYNPSLMGDIIVVISKCRCINNDIVLLLIISENSRG